AAADASRLPERLFAAGAAPSARAGRDRRRSRGGCERVAPAARGGRRGRRPAAARGLGSPPRAALTRRAASAAGVLAGDGATAAPAAGELRGVRRLPEREHTLADPARREADRLSVPRAASRRDPGALAARAALPRCRAG